MQSEHFFPEQKLSYQGINNFKAQYEGVKAAHEADLAAVESCFGKCTVSTTDGKVLSEREGACLRKCYARYFDASLLIEKEMKHYVHPQNI